jgi:hypothetical protein
MTREVAATMTRAERILYHQVHPIKLATDIGAAIVSLLLLWQHQLVAGLLVAFVPPPVASALLLTSVDFEGYRDRPIGAYLRRFMTPLVQALRLVGFGVSAVGAWEQQWPVLAAGWLIVAGCWSYGLVIEAYARPR